MKLSPLKHALGVAVLACSLQATPALANQQSVRLNNQALELDRQGKTDEAIAMLNEALAIEPDSETIRRNRCLVLRGAMKLDAAMADVTELLRGEPYNPVNLFIRGTIFYWKGQRDNAMKDFNAAIEQDGENPEFVRMYSAYMRRLDPGAYHYISLRRLGRQGWTWNNEQENEQFVYPTGGIGFSEKNKSALTPQGTEVRLHGRIVSRDAAKGILKLETVAFGVANGRFKALDTPKVKNVLLGKSEVELGGRVNVPLGQMRDGDFLVLIGQDAPTGFTARRIFAVDGGHAHETLSKLYNAKELSKFEYNVAFPKTNKAAIEDTVIFPRPAQKEEDQDGGASVVVKDEAGPILFTTSPQLFWEQQQLESPLDQTKRVQGALARVPAEVTWNEKTKLAVLSRHAGAGNSVARQVVALRLKEAPAALTLANQLPKRGEKLWTSGAGEIGGTLTVVLAADEERIVLVGDDPEGSERQPGQALLNDKGEVLGIIVSVEGEFTIVAPYTVMRGVLQQAAVKAGQ